MSPAVRKRQPTVTRPELLHQGSDDQFRTMMHNLLSVAQKIQENRSSHARMLGITGAQFTILTGIAHLQGSGGVSVNTVARHLHLSPTFTTMETAKLVEKGIVQKRQDRADRRRVRLMLSARGWKLLEDIVPIQQPVNDAMFADLSKEDFFTFSRIIATVADNVEHGQALLEYLKRSRPRKKPTGAGT